MRQIQKSIADSAARADFATVSPTDKVADAISKMIAMDTDCVLVMDDGQLVGIFTERDFLNRVCSEQRDPAATTLRDVMTTPPETLHPDDGVAYAINRMAVGGYRNVPIVENGKPVSVLDVRLVMMHLIKIFAEVERERAKSEADAEWVDIGGG